MICSGNGTVRSWFYWCLELFPFSSTRYVTFMMAFRENNFDEQTKILFKSFKTNLGNVVETLYTGSIREVYSLN
jgi:hypothetical protein